MCLCACTCVHVEIRGQFGCYSAKITRFFETEFLSESWKVPWRQGVRTSEPQGSAHFCLPSPGITAGTTTFGFFRERSGVNSGSHAYVAGWAISQAPYFQTSISWEL